MNIFLKKRVITIVLAIIIFVVFTGMSFSAEENKKANAYWLNFGIGAGTGLAFSGSVSYEFSGKIISLRSATALELLGSDDSMSDFGILFGLSPSKSKTYQYSGAIGVSMVNGGGENTIGLPIEAQFSVRAFPFLGVVFYGFGNINSKKSFFGITAGIQIGKF